MGMLDWSTADVEIANERLAKDGLCKRRQELEAIVAPLTTNKKTNDAILFRGKRRYLVTPLVKLGNKNRLAVHALQHVYSIEAAWKIGDTDKVVRATYLFARADHELWLAERAGVGSIDAAFSTVRSKQKRKDTRLGKTDLARVPDILLESIVGSHRRSRKRNWLQLATDEINQQCKTSIDRVTVRREMQRRGIWDKSTKVDAATKTKVHLSAPASLV